ncbi:MAG TPA: FHA domain-containing protein [Anaerolineales bacterium]|nr:FHA domain-containing protein [Anaerolineales bacterium]
MPEKVCPKCHRKNQETAEFCIFCGGVLSGNVLKEIFTTQKMAGPTGLQPAEPARMDIRTLKVPTRGIALYIAETPEPVALRDEESFVIGRKLTDVNSDKFVDLTAYGAYENGVSHRHAMIRQHPGGYEILDLGSTNGTRLNDHRLIPNTPYPITTGAQIRLGRLSLYAVFAIPKTAAAE